MKKALLFVLILSGCGTTSPVLKPDVAAPAAYNVQVAGTAITADWWHRFDSAELASLVQQALAGSPDLAIAAERVRQAEAQVRVAGASLFPTLDAGSGSRISKNGGETARSGDVSLSTSYELDLWGRNAAGVRGAEAAARATAFDAQTARLTLISGVADAYFEILSLRERLAVARENLGIAERVLELVRVRARNGAVSPLDVARQEAAVLNQRAALPALEQQERQTLAALAVLIGRLPEGFDVKGRGLDALAVPEVSPGLPSTLLVRRPDLAAAEAELAGANADLTAARAALLPSISLTGSAGLASSALLGVLNGPAAGVSLAASVVQSIFDGGRRRAGVTIAESRERELAETYRKAILSAFADVESALAAVNKLAERETLQAGAAERSREALRIAEVRYREGADDLLSVLDAQRTLFSAEDQEAQTRLQRLQAATGLYRALGGGWRMEG